MIGRGERQTVGALGPVEQSRWTLVPPAGQPLVAGSPGDTEFIGLICDAGIDPGKVLELELPLDQAADLRTDRPVRASDPSTAPVRRSWGRRPLRMLFGPAVGASRSRCADP